MEAIVIITLIRLLVPFAILRFPLIGIALSILADLYDWKFYPINNARELAEYQSWDKAMDFYYHLFILYVAIAFKDKIVKWTAVFLFAYRLVGLALFTIFDSRIFLFIFPNFFENFVILYLIYRALSKKEILVMSKRIFFVIAAIIVIPKVIHEYFMHLLLKQPWEVFDVGAYLNTTGAIAEYINYLSYGTLFYLLPIGMLPYLLSKKQNKKKKK